MKETDANETLEGFTPAELALLEERQPGMLEDLKAGKMAAREIARLFLKTHGSDTATKGDATPPTPPAVQLPLWSEPVRAVPNGALRSALFGAIKRGRRPMLDGVRLEALEGIEITYTGPRLDQGDLDAWESLLHIMRTKNLGEECRTTSAALLRLMGFADSGKHRKILEDKIGRLNASAVKIKCGRYTYMGSLLDWAAKDENTQEWVISLNPKIAALFAPDQYTLIQWGVRRALGGHPLAQWLHGYFSSHAAPHPIKVETLRRLSGSESGELKSFAQKLKKALEAVGTASAAAGEVFAWRIEGGLVYVKRTPSPSQRRHLAKRGQ